MPGRAMSGGRWCAGTRPSKQLIGEVREPLPARPGQAQKIEHESVRNGVARIFLEVEPLGGRRHVELSERRTRKDWARFIRGMLEERCAEAERVVLVLGNLNTHGIESLYETCRPELALALAERLEIHCTPKHGSWLNIAEIELSALCGQCSEPAHTPTATRCGRRSRLGSGIGTTAKPRSTGSSEHPTHA